MKKVKTITIILAIILISLVSFGGVYVQTQNRMENKVKNYSLGKELSGYRAITIKVSDETEKVVKDSEGNVIEDATDEEIAEKGYTTEEKSVNEEKDLTAENYEIIKSTIENRLKKLQADDYTIALNKETGEIKLELVENDNTDMYAYYIFAKSNLSLVVDESNTELLNQKDIKDAKYNYTNNSKGEYQVYLELTLTKEGQAKMKEISNNYAILQSEIEEIENKKSEESSSETENTENVEETNIQDTTAETKKTVSLKINDTEYKIKSIDNNKTVKIEIGSEITTTATLQSYLSKAAEIEMLLTSGLYPIQYELSQNEYIFSEISNKEIAYVCIAVISIFVIISIILIIKYKMPGLLSVISYIGFVAIFSLLLRYTNVIITIEGIGAIILILAINLKMNEKILKQSVKYNLVNEAVKNTYKEMSLKLIPVAILSIILCFIKWININSFGMIMFWGLVLIAIYNITVTKTLLKINNK